MTTREADEDAIEIVGVHIEIGNCTMHDHVHHSFLFFLGCTLDAELVFAWFPTERRAAMATSEAFRATQITREASAYLQEGQHIYEGSAFSVGDVPIRMEPDTIDEGTTMDMARHMACTALNTHVRNGDEHSSVGIRRNNRRNCARPHTIARRYAGRKDPCRKDDERD